MAHVQAHRSPLLIIATIFSWILEPVVLLPISFIVAAYRAGVSVHIAVVWMIGIAMPTFLYRIWAKRSRGLDWDMNHRSDRVKPVGYFIVYLLCVAGVVAVYESRLLPVVVLCIAWTIGFFLITSTWTKISGHVGGDTLAIGSIIMSLGIHMWPLLIALPIVS